jgi:uncharacterized protein (DUF1778 family)
MPKSSEVVAARIKPHVRVLLEKAAANRNLSVSAFIAEMVERAIAKASVEA